MIDGVAAMDRFTQADRGRARHQPRPGDGRLLQVGGHRGRPEVRAGQADRQLDLHEGGRGEVPSAQARLCRKYGAAVVVMAFDEDGQADNLERRKADLRAGLPDPRSTRSASRPRTSSSTPTSSPSRPASRSTRPTASTSSRPPAGSRRTCPGRTGLRRHLERVVLVPRQQPGPRGDPRGVPVPRHPGRPGHGHRQRRRAGASTTRSTPSCASGSRTSSSTVAPDAAERLLEIAERLQQRRRGRRRSATEEWRALPVGERITHALVKGIDAHVEADTEELRAEIADARRPPDRGDRGPADGRHERRRRPVRRRQDVPAAGGEVGPGDEEGRRLPDPVHRGRRSRQTRSRRRARTPTARS